MRLTRFTDIGLRVLIYLSRADNGRSPVTVSEIAQQFDIPLNHLVKVVGQLARKGWVQATRGRNGGLRLAIDAGSLTVGSVLRELEGTSELVDCEGQQCGLKSDCILRGALRTGMNAFYDAMNQFTLADLTHGTTGDKIVHMHANFLRQNLEINTRLPN